jgi:hypothetical protein
MKTHQIVSPGKQKCNICDEICPTATLLAEHKLTHCKVISGSLCTGCKTNLTSEDQFYSHVKSHCGGSSTSSAQLLPLPCIVCRQTLMSEIEIQLHAKFHTKAYETLPALSPLTCCLCLRTEDKPRGGGIQQNGTQNYFCGECCRKTALISPPKPSPPKRGPGSTLPSLSPEGPAGDKSYSCIKCQMSFGSEDEIQSHVTSHLLNEGSRHECRLCPQTHFSSPLKLQAHLIEHTFEGCPSFTCYMCSTLFTTAPALQQHMLEHGPHTRPYDCSHCHLKFFFRAELENHVLSHEEVKRSIVERYADFSKALLGEGPVPVPRGNGRVGHQKGSRSGSATNGHAHSRSKSTEKKRKKFFYRSDDSDEELMETDLAPPSDQNPPPINIKEERMELDTNHFDPMRVGGEEAEGRLSNGIKRRKSGSGGGKTENPDLESSGRSSDSDLLNGHTQAEGQGQSQVQKEIESP